MKSTGIVRKVDELGRIVLPIELRRTLDIAEKDALEIYVDESSIILSKYEPACIFCGDAKNIENYKGKNICAKCIKEITKKT
ncbi:MAG: AbrB/MazE/SpoVT family DNA-binding domain-containing protein [Clostridiales bacterium]|nr:AbrB/MazE/SpoVT family DNA-binding domain-containing protein [Clostridiales bacterium]